MVWVGWSRRAVVVGLLGVLVVAGCAGDQDVPVATPQAVDEEAATEDEPATEGEPATDEATEDATDDPTADAEDDPPDAEDDDTTDGSGEEAEPAASTGDDALAFYRSTEPICAAHAEETGNSPVPPEYFAEAAVVEQLDADRWLIEDGEGARLVVDLAQEVVHAEEGPDAVLPYWYSFGCPPELYPGTLPS